MCFRSIRCIADFPTPSSLARAFPLLGVHGLIIRCMTGTIFQFNICSHHMRDHCEGSLFVASQEIESEMVYIEHLYQRVFWNSVHKDRKEKNQVPVDRKTG